MSEFDDKLHAILSDPAEMERIGRLAAELMGGGSGEGPSADGDGDLLRRISGVLGGAGEEGKAGLIEALSPYLRPERSARLRRALRIAGMLRVAGTVLREEGT